MHCMEGEDPNQKLMHDKKEKENLRLQQSTDITEVEVLSMQH